MLRHTIMIGGIICKSWSQSDDEWELNASI